MRIYWYDGAGAGGHFTSDQAVLASSDDVKVKLGFLNAYGHQNGISAQMATDLIELSRQNAIAEALLLSGDDDLRLGVQIAQSFGVRVHLLSLAPSRALGLLYESDTSAEWQSDTIERFMSIRRNAALNGPLNGGASVSCAPHGAGAMTDPREWEPRLESAAKEFADMLDDNDLDSLEAYWATSRGVPSELDRRLLPQARAAIGRDLDQPEKRFVRSCFQRYVLQRFEEDYEEGLE